MHTEYWVVRAKCSCGGYLWTNPGSPSVQCSCLAGRIAGGSLEGDAGAVTDEAEWEAAVAADLGVDPADLTIEQAA